MSPDKLIEHVINKSTEIDLFKEEDIILQDFRVVDYANVIFNRELEKNRRLIHNYLNRIGIKYIGRFGEWDYLWSDQSLLTGKEIANQV
jgi:protoporphyrinogen oxidase